MASIKVEGFTEVLDKLHKFSKREHMEGIAKKAVDAAKGVVVSSTKSAVASSEYGPYRTGSVAASITPTDAKVNEWGVFAVAKPSGRDAKGTSNTKKASLLEYGTPRMKARPWRAKAAAGAESKALKIMEDIVKEEMELE